MPTYLSQSKKETETIAREISQGFQGGTVVCLEGDLGAGKTTFSQGVLAYFGAEEPYTSPTFVIMKEYQLPQEKQGIKRIYHIDTYRIEAKDLENIGFEEWCSDPSGLVLLEWPERVKELLPEKRTTIHLKQRAEESREITLS